MRRATPSLSVCSLLSGLLLWACHGAPEAGLATPAEDALGTVEAESCSGSSVTTLTIAALSTEFGEMAGNGSWAVGYPANAVRLEYSIDGTLYSTEERGGGSGTWYFSASPLSCGSHTLTVKAYPMVIDSAGNRTTCWSTAKSVSQSVSEPCALTWQYSSTESCYDWFGTSCYKVNWSWYNTCSSAPEGKPCSVSGDTCYLVRSSTYVDQYACM